MKVTVKYPRWHATLDQAKEVSFEVTVLGSFNPRRYLENVFAAFGNHPDAEVWDTAWRGAKMRSMSVGDFVCLGDQWYQCAGCGWKEVSEDWVNTVMSLPVYDTWADKNLR